MQPPSDPLSLLEAHRDAGLEIRLRSIRGGGWRVEISENGEDFTTLEPAHSGHPTPAAAIEEVDRRIASWKLARTEAAAFEVSAFFEAGKLERRRIMVDGEEVDGFAAQTPEGEWIEGLTPAAAVKAAKARQLERAAERGATQGGARP